MQKISKNTVVNSLICLSLIILFGAGCGLVKNPFRDYTEKPFSSAEWLKGDAVERGRMYLDIFKTRMLDGKSTEDVKKLLGEPEKKQTVEGREVWLYRVEHRYRTPMKFFPVSFESKRGAFAGRVEGGTISMLVED
jgi:hypothetical protein